MSIIGITAAFFGKNKKGGDFLKITKEEYQKYVKKTEAGSNVLKDCLCAFAVGGIICTFGQFLGDFYQTLGLSLETAKTSSTVTLVFLAAFLTAIGVFDDIARRAGAGTLVPITGFSNAMVSPAMEFKSEGFVTGVGAKLFSIAGPVIAFGTFAGVIYGFIYWLFTL